MIPAHLAPLFVQVPRWNGNLNVYRGRPSENPYNALGTDIVYHAAHRAAQARIPRPDLKPGFRFNHEISS